MLRQILQVLTMVLMVAALLLMGFGYGLNLSLLGFFMCMATCNRLIMGVFCLLFGAQVLGYLAAVYGNVGWVGDIIVVIGLVSLHFRCPLQKVIAECQAGVLLLIWCTLVLLLFYFYGPRNSYALSLIINFIKTGFLSFVAFFFIFRNRSVDWQRLGLLAIFSGLVYLGIAGRIGSVILPYSILDIGALRIMNESVEASSNPFFTHRVAFLPLLGFMLIYSKDVTKPKTRKDITILIISLFTTAVMIGWSGARQGLFFLLIGMSSIFMCKLEGNYRQYLVPVIVGCLLLVVIVHIGVSQDFSLYAVLFDSDKTYYQRLNRDTNFDAALWLFKQKPLLGHGLGGYYAPGYSSAGDPVFAHNVFLDLLSQTGLIGTAAFFSPLLLLRTFRRQIQMLAGFQNGNAVLPVFCVLVLHGMIDSPLSELGTFIGLIAAIGLL